MAAARDESKIVTPFMPSLLHCASVKIAISLYQEFDVETLEWAFAEIQKGDLTTSEGNSTKSRRAKESLLDIPAHLRRGVMEAVFGSDHTVSKWIRHHSEFKVKRHNLHRRSDGSVDTVKTAENLVLNARFDIRDRFRLACKYCLEKSVKALWAEMVKSGEAENFRASRKGVVSFWVERLREQPRVSWTQSLIHSLGSCLSWGFSIPETQVPRWSASFHLLRPEQRQRYLHLLETASFDDLRFCLYTITKEEEEQIILKRFMVFRLLHLHLEWPLQTLFLETANKLWNYIDDDVFHYLLKKILNLNEKWKDFNYSELFDRFWNASPLYLRESVREWSQLRDRIDSFFYDKRIN